MDHYHRYEVGLNILLQHVPESSRAYADTRYYQQRLRDNIHLARQSGDTPIRRAERLWLIDRLNQIAHETIDLSFQELCDLNAFHEERRRSLVASFFSWAWKAVLILFLVIFLVSSLLPSLPMTEIVPTPIPSAPPTRTPITIEMR